MPLPPPSGSDLHCEISQVQKLWSEVIKRASHDLTDSSVGRLQREDAVNWITGAPCFEGDAADYFGEVCEMAGVDTKQVRASMMRNLHIAQPKLSSLPQQLDLFGYC